MSTLFIFVSMEIAFEIHRFNVHTVNVIVHLKQGELHNFGWKTSHQYDPLFSGIHTLLRTCLGSPASGLGRAHQSRVCSGVAAMRARNRELAQLQAQPNARAPVRLHGLWGLSEHP